MALTSLTLQAQQQAGVATLGAPQYMTCSQGSNGVVTCTATGVANLMPILGTLSPYVVTYVIPAQFVVGEFGAISFPNQLALTGLTINVNGTEFFNISVTTTAPGGGCPDRIIWVSCSLANPTNCTGITPPPPLRFQPGVDNYITIKVWGLASFGYEVIVTICPQGSTLGGSVTCPVAVVPLTDKCICCPVIATTPGVTPTQYAPSPKVTTKINVGWVVAGALLAAGVGMAGYYFYKHPEHARKVAEATQRAVTAGAKKAVELTKKAVGATKKILG